MVRKKSEVRPRIGHGGPEAEQSYSSTLSLTSALGDVGGQRHVLAALPPRKPATHFTKVWVGPRAGLDGCGKPRPTPEFDPRTVQPVVSHYTG
jgi:hypothetical protein